MSLLFRNRDGLASGTSTRQILAGLGLRLRKRSCPGMAAAVLLMISTMVCTILAADDSTNSPGTIAPTPTGAADDLLTKSTQDLSDGNLDQALGEVSAAIQLDPKNASAYELRGSIYIEKKLWDRAERDYGAAYQISPDIAYKYKMAEIKFLQEAFGDARFRFAALEGDARLGDLAAYKVFLCDLLGGHEAIAAQDLAAIDQAGKHPSYYFSHGAWDLFHRQMQEGTKFFATAQKLYDSSTFKLYYSSLIEVQRFHPMIATFTTKDGRKFDKAGVFPEEDGLRVYSSKGWITIPFEQLPDDLSTFPDELRDLIVRKREARAPVASTIRQVSFTDKSGKSYDQVRWTLADTGLSVMTADGWKLVPFDELPADLSVFPSELQQAIILRRQSAATSSKLSGIVSFSTKQGKQYDQVRALLTGSGLRVLAPDGWLVIPLNQLPEDLSAFPADMQQAIQEQRSNPATPTLSAVVSFTTKQGKRYDEVRTSLTDAGLRVLAPDGWTLVPFDQLPDDLSPFPTDWHAQMTAKNSAGAEASNGMTLVSFTTRSGKEYNQVRAAVGRDGLRLLTSEGLITVPFEQLPTDLSPFPADWRGKLAVKNSAISSSTSSTNH